MNNWIKCSERNPNIEIDNMNDQVDDVLVIFKRKCKNCDRDYTGIHYGIGWYSDDRWNLTELLEDDCYPDNYINEISITHWMPLPSPPEIEK